MHKRELRATRKENALNAITAAPNLPHAEAQEAELENEIASAGKALFLAAFTVVVGSFTFATLIFLFHFRF